MGTAWHRQGNRNCNGRDRGGKARTYLARTSGGGPWLNIKGRPNSIVAGWMVSLCSHPPFPFPTRCCGSRRPVGRTKCCDLGIELQVRKEILAGGWSEAGGSDQAVVIDLCVSPAQLGSGALVCLPLPLNLTPKQRGEPTSPQGTLKLHRRQRLRDTLYAVCVTTETR